MNRNRAFPVCAALLIGGLIGCENAKSAPQVSPPQPQVKLAPPKDAEPIDPVIPRTEPEEMEQPKVAEAVTSFTIPEPVEIPPEAVLREARLNLFETKTVRLVTDLPESDIHELLQTADQVWPALGKAFGDLPDGVPVDAVPLTAFVVRDEDSFVKAGLFGSLPTEIHGKHEGWQFWMRWPSSSYYQRHLFAHEAAHCYSLITKPNLPGGWMEAIAEWFATYSDDGGKLTFGVIPETSDSVPGWGRIQLLQQDLKDGQRYSAVDVAKMSGDRFQGVPTAYAWGWAFATLLQSVQPETFRELIHQTAAGTCQTKDIVAAATQLDRSGLWDWWLEAIEYGVDPSLAAPRASSNANAIAAKAGWQGVGQLLQPGERLKISADGLVVLNKDGREWKSTADGIRADYFRGQPIGMLLGRTLNRGRWSSIAAIGQDGHFGTADGGELFLRVNDAWNDLENNAGEFTLRIAAEGGE